MSFKNDYFPVHFNKKIITCKNNTEVPKTKIQAIKMNNLISERFFPDNNQVIIPEYRGEFKICGKYVNKDHKIKDNSKTSKLGLNPGKGTSNEYFNNINIESGLKQLSDKNNKQYIPKNPECSVDSKSSYILETPMCQNTKAFLNKHDINIVRPYFFSCNSPEPDKLYVCKNQTNSNYTESPLQFNYIKETKNCNTGCLPGITNKVYNNPISKDKRHYIIENKNKEFLPIGPKRVNHKLENVWNNQRVR